MNLFLRSFSTGRPSLGFSVQEKTLLNLRFPCDTLTHFYPIWKGLSVKDKIIKALKTGLKVKSDMSTVEFCWENAYFTVSLKSPGKFFFPVEGSYCFPDASLWTRDQLHSSNILTLTVQHVPVKICEKHDLLNCGDNSECPGWFHICNLFVLYH